MGSAPNPAADLMHLVLEKLPKPIDYWTDSQARDNLFDALCRAAPQFERLARKGEKKQLCLELAKLTYKFVDAIHEGNPEVKALRVHDVIVGIMERYELVHNPSSKTELAQRFAPHAKNRRLYTLATFYDQHWNWPARPPGSPGQTSPPAPDP